MKNDYITLAITLAFALGACKTSKSSKSADSGDIPMADTTWVVKYERSPCFGDCAIYRFYLTEANNGLLDVKHNFMDPGWYYADLDEESVHALLAELEPEAWWNEDLRLQPEVMDLPARSIVYKHIDGLRWFAVGGRTSENAEYMCSLFDDLIENGKWTPTEIRPNDPEVPQPSDVIVQLKENVDIERWMQNFENFGITLVKKVAPNLQYYVVTWDLNKGTANDFLQYIKHDRDVIDAQWDQALNGRSKKSESIEMQMHNR